MTRIWAMLMGAARRLAPTARLVARPVLMLALVWVSRIVVGEWVTGSAVTVVALVWALRGWVALERRLDAKHRRPDVVVPVGPLGPGRDVGRDHVAFARALVAVSARYLAHCEDQADKQTGDASREGWR
jgi:hypothetical protein